MYYIIRPWKYRDFIIGMRIDPRSFVHYETLEAAENARKQWERGGVLYTIHQIKIVNENKHIVVDSFHF